MYGLLERSFILLKGARSLQLENQRCPNTVGNEGIGERACYLMDGNPTSTVSREKIARIDLLQCCNGRRNDRLKERTVQMEAPNDSIDRCNARNLLRVAYDVDNTR